MLARGKKVGKSFTCLCTQFGAAETHRVETERERAITDQRLGIRDPLPC